MKKTFSLLFTILLLVSCTQEKKMEITIENPSDFDRMSELVEIPLDKVKEKVIVTDSLVYEVLNSEGEVIPSQVTYDRKLIFQPVLKANETKTFTIKTGEAQTFESKTYARFITERKDDFAWENDRVAFRAYGPALIETDGPSNGIDAWFKRTNNLIIDKWYKADLSGEASYHDDHGEGLDDYKVGRTLGAGAMAPYVNEKLWLNDNFVQEEILENGPLRSTFKLFYKNLDVDGKSIAENRTISIDAGSQLSKVIQAYTIKEPMTVAAGIVKRQNGDSIISADNYIIYSEPQSDKVDNIYMALVLPEGIEKSIVDTYDIIHTKTNKKETHSHVLAVTTQQPNIPVAYYAGYGWSKFGFTAIADFEKYIKDFSASIKNPLVITYK
ncbi:DUF4861 family protein [Dysgonomonas sp. Marseille-P4677]|uniref:DUF4861 family protein n=1 Tax=Dysgonomonas sp. Marseille-P4677 TaxID=2364790 RepID=UPI0019129C30|nr:DUF4861 family protein [Dysgonomonas sp. Marseille-P4677]MBK5720484.1 DUF4861 family protein [Dysgonomonas sp. Marseille-P4677]